MRMLAGVLAVLAVLGACTSAGKVDNAILAFSDPTIDGREPSGVDRVTGTPMPARSGANLQQISSNAFRVHIPALEGHYVSQSDIDICWAAAAEMVHRFERNPISQDLLASKFVLPSDKTGKAARPSQIVFALRPQLAEDYIRDSSFVLIPSPRAAVRTEDMIDWISEGSPIIAGIVRTTDEGVQYGHVYVVDGLVYHEVNDRSMFFNRGEKNINDENFWTSRPYAERYYAISEVEMLDPWNGNGRTRMSGAEFAKSVGFVLSPIEAQKNLEYLRRDQQRRAQERARSNMNSQGTTIDPLGWLRKQL